MISKYTHVPFLAVQYRSPQVDDLQLNIYLGLKIHASWRKQNINNNTILLFNSVAWRL